MQWQFGKKSLCDRILRCFPFSSLSAQNESQFPSRAQSPQRKHLPNRERRMALPSWKTKYMRTASRVADRKYGFSTLACLKSRSSFTSGWMVAFFLTGVLEEDFERGEVAD